MEKYSEQDLKYAAEFREEIHREALAIVRKTLPDQREVIDRHPVEDYFQKHWDYPGKWYTVVAIPYGYKSRKEFVQTIVRDTLAGKAPAPEPPYTRTVRETAKTAGRLKEEAYHQLTSQEENAPKPKDDPLSRLLAEYPDLVVEYFVVEDGAYQGYESHRTALKKAYERLEGDWDGDPGQAKGKSVPPETIFASESRPDKLNYRKAFLYPPHENSYTGLDFVRVNEALFPEGTDQLEAYGWTTDWSDYFDEGREWWGTLCLTVYDRALCRFVVILASATD